MELFKNLFGRGSVEPAHHPVIPEGSEPDFIAIDVETACADQGSICQIGLVGFSSGVEVFSYETLVDPQTDFDGFNVGIHGISKDQVRGKPRFDNVHRILDFYLNNRISVSHSAFDRTALKLASDAYDKPQIATKWLDSVAVARKAWPNLESHRLNVLASYLGIPLNHHDALSDARAAGMVIIKAIDHTGIGLHDWMTHRKRSSYRSPIVTTAPAASGPLLGHTVTISGDLSVSRQQMADLIAEAGGKVASSTTKKTTILLLGDQDVSTFAGKPKSSKHLKAEALFAEGQSIRFLTENELRALMDR